jgi:hypothetical protein
MDFREVELGNGLNWANSGYGLVTGNCECCTEIQDYIYCGELINIYLILKALLRAECK